MKKLLLLLGSTLSLTAAAQTKPILADLRVLQALNIKTVFLNDEFQIGQANITPEQEILMREYTHRNGKCGAFESLEGQGAIKAQSFQTMIATLKTEKFKNDLYNQTKLRNLNVSLKPEVETALAELKEDNLKQWILWFSNFPTRFNKGPKANDHVTALFDKLENEAQSAPYPVKVEYISHRSTPQKSLRVHIEGKVRPQETIVLGGHFDSISGWGSANSRAPGADDNASGSSNLLETLRVLLTKPQPERSIDFFFYAGEESGLLGSAEIAAQYKSQNKDVIAVLQLDMTLFPGSGELTIGNVSDFTDAWLRDYLVSVNELYLKVKLIDDECGYACSDHASWHKNGFPALMPFESNTSNMNNNIHTENDLLDSRSSLRHSLVFSKIALIFAMDLANSSVRRP